MRHSDIKLTMGVYTDPKLLDVARALDSLPTLPLNEQPQASEMKATGTNGGADQELRARTLVPPLVPTLLTRGHFGSAPDKTTDSGRIPSIAVTPCDVKRKTPLTSAVNGGLEYPKGVRTP